MEKVLVFLDYPNIDKPARDQGIRMDYADLLDYLGEGRFLVDAHCYFPVDPRNEHAWDGKIKQLWQDGFLVHDKTGTIAGESFKCNFDVEMTIDILRTVHSLKPDIMVLCSGDGDFVPLVLELRKMGIRVEVAAYESAMSERLKRSCSGFISLDQYLEQCLAQDEALSEYDSDIPDEVPDPLGHIPQGDVFGHYDGVPPADVFASSRGTGAC